MMQGNTARASCKRVAGNTRNIFGRHISSWQHACGVKYLVWMRRQLLLCKQRKPPACGMWVFANTDASKNWIRKVVDVLMQKMMHAHPMSTHFLLFERSTLLFA